MVYIYGILALLVIALYSALLVTTNKKLKAMPNSDQMAILHGQLKMIYTLGLVVGKIYSTTLSEVTGSLGCTEVPS